MKYIKKTVGIVIIVLLFMGLFVWMVQDSSLEIALKAWGTAFGIVIVLIIGLWLADSD